MKHEAQRIAIAEACGWRFEPRRAIRPDGSVTSDFPLFNQLFHVPYYLNDLNAMHEALSVLSDSQLEDYWGTISYICERDFKLTGKKLHRDRASATPRQQSEAFLRTIGKWQEGDKR